MTFYWPVTVAHQIIGIGTAELGDGERNGPFFLFLLYGQKLGGGDGAAPPQFRQP